MPPRSAPAWQRDELLPTYDLMGRRPRLVLPASSVLAETEPSPLLEAIRAYLERVR
jgi:hypothetical protein